MRGLQRTVDEDRYCVDLLIQLSAARSALDRVRMSIVESHTRGCVADAIREGEGDEKIDELMSVLQLFLKQGG